MGERHVELIRRYYEALNRHDLEAQQAVFTDDVVHYYLAGQEPTRGVDHLVRFNAKLTAQFNAEWLIDHALEQGNEIVVEWTCFWTPPGGSKRLAVRGAEWYIIRAGKIAEVRPYYNWLMTADSELRGFPYAERGYATAR
ncbi:MAG: nuclear transport factor 2 family protein [Candidatus Tectomicrobia bacterium]|nr:nuclear transport factor 2 family protein [Candidatus Tectomicrobia bacterium]